MKVIKTIEEFEEIIKHDKVLVDFYAAWCGPCRMLAPVLEELSEEVKDVEIVKVDVDQLGSLAARYGIMSIPTLLVFVKGELTNKAVGYQDKQALLKLIK